MKKNHNIQNKLNKQEKEKLSNRIVLLSSFTILYGMLLLFFERMCSYSATVLGALTFMEYLMWGSLLGAMGCAAWSAYKEKKGYYLYSGMLLFVFLSMLVVLKINSLPDNRAYLLCYMALAAAFIMAQVYNVLKASGKFAGKFKISFLIVIFLILLLLVVAVVEPGFWTALKSMVGM